MRIGSLCSGYGGLDLAVEEVFGADVAWFAEFDPAPSMILNRHWPDVPNHGDMTRIAWSTVEPVDIIAGGTPCQDLSQAGKRRGMTEGTRSNLWVQMREAIATIRPSWVVWENVRGAYSACADSEMGSCPRCLGKGGEHRPFLRAFHRVLGDLSELGYVGRAGLVKASDAGAPHARARVFVVAQPAGGGGGILAPRTSSPQARRSGHGIADGSGGVSPVADTGGETFRLGTGLRASEPGGFGGRRPGNDYLEEPTWGQFSAAIARWEGVIGRSAPRATDPDGRNGQHRLSARFVEWMMGLPSGHVTDPTIGLTRNEQLKALGNGVVPQQAELALRTLLS